MSSEKEITSVSLDADIAAQASEADESTSFLVNKWLGEYQQTGRQPVFDDSQRDMILEELDEREAAFETVVSDVRDSFDEIRAVVEEDRIDEDEVVAATSEEIDAVYESFTQLQFEGLNRDTRIDWEASNRGPENIAIQTKAEKLGMSPEELVSELENRDRQNDYIETGGQR